jgi:malate dehydrogenase
MVPVPSQCKVSGEPLGDLISEDEISELVQKTSDGGAEIVGLLKTGSAYFAPSSAAAIMVKSIISDSNNIMPACSWVSGEYGINDVFLGVPTMLGSNGVTKVVELDLKDNELTALKRASNEVKLKVEELNSILSQ